MICNLYIKVKRPVPFSQKFVKNILAKIAAKLKIKSNFEITVLLVGDRKIRELNKKYKKKNKLTDVFSFSQKEGEKIILPAKESNYLGDIFICYPQLIRQAKKFKQPLKKELALLLIHGFLHLLGHQDETNEDYKKMKRLQETILSKIYD